MATTTTTTTTSAPPAMVQKSLDLVRNNAVINNRPSSNVGKVVETAVVKCNNNDPDTKLYKQKIKQVIHHPNSSVLGYCCDNVVTPRRTYVLSPLLRYMQERCRQPHCIYVAYAPTGTGKTTASQAFLQQRVGMAFSPPKSSTLDYYAGMLSLLQVSAVNPPKGWLKCLIQVLHQAAEAATTAATTTTAATGQNKKPPGRKQQLAAAYLILDEFMSHGMLNPFDVALLLSIRTLIRQKNVICIVLTSNEDAANYMLDFDQPHFHCIRPMVPAKLLPKIRLEYKNDPPLRFEWDKHVSMKWSARNLKAVVLEHVPAAERELADAAVDDYLGKLKPHKRKRVVPGQVLAHLEAQKAAAKLVACPSCEISCTVM